MATGELGETQRLHLGAEIRASQLEGFTPLEGTRALDEARTPRG